MLWDIKVQLDERKRGKRPNGLPTQGKVALDGVDVLVVSVCRLLHDRIGVSLKVGDESALAGRGCGADSVEPESVLNKKSTCVARERG